MVIELLDINVEHGLSSPPEKGEYPEGGRGFFKGNLLRKVKNNG